MICSKHQRLNCNACNPTSTTAASTITYFYSVPVAGVAVPVAANSLTGRLALIPTIGNTAPVKRKRGPVKGSKRLKKTIIDDEVACAIFRDLRLNNDFLNSGRVLAWALQPDDDDFITIHDYVACGQVHEFGVKVQSIIRVVPNANSLYEGEDPLEYQMDFNEDPSAKGKLRMMLWHGTRKEYLASILQNGLNVPPLQHQMFGAGIYFADRVSKSCQYTNHGLAYDGFVSYLLLCDVLVGNMFKVKDARPGTTAPPVGYDSIKGFGQRIPDRRMAKEINGSVWPLGTTIDNNEDNHNAPYLRFNEYIVYNSKQVQPKYLVKVEFTEKPFHEKLR